jgi:hypothetical protein
MLNHAKTALALWVVAAASASAMTAETAAPPPRFVFESMLDQYFDDSSGLLSFGDVELAFAPEPPFAGAVAVVNSENTIVAKFDYFPDYVVREGVFARARVQGPADVTLTTPGVYNIVYLIDGQPVSRLPVVLEETSTGDDPFNPEKTYRYFGLWERYAHVTMGEYKGEAFPLLTFWAGARDLGEKKRGEGFNATLSRDGEVIGHSIAQRGSIEDRHYRRVTTILYRPHDDKNAANAEPLLKAEWFKDGDYEITIRRASDDTVLRTFVYSAKDGAMVPLAESSLSHEPAIDTVLGRVSRKNRTQFEFHEASWIRVKP